MVIPATNHHHPPPSSPTSDMMTITTTLRERSTTNNSTSSSTLPNFSSVPCFNIKWGCRKQLRCIKDSPSSSSSADLTTSLRRSSASRSIDAIREKLVLDFRAEVHQMQAAFLHKSSYSDVVNAGGEVRPWNLRTRRAVCKDPNNSNSNNTNLPVLSDRKPGFFPAEVKYSPARKYGGDYDEGDCDDAGGGGPRAKFASSLSKQEIEEDFLAILGARPARRPKKRPKYVQKQIDAVFPGFWLSEITADMYKVNEQP